jgi:N-acetylated-alpha-linked acidic dipeptidase
MTPDERQSFNNEWLWHMPLKTVNAAQLKEYSPGYFTMLDHPSYGSYWRTFDIESRHGEFEVPALHLTGWYDALLNGTIRNFAGLRANARTTKAREGQRLIVGPWTHSGPTSRTTAIGDVDFGPAAGLDSDSLRFAWFDYWLKDRPTGITSSAPVRLFIMGANEWRDEQEWPLARAVPTPFYLHSAGGANTLDGDGMLSRESPRTEPPDRFEYDPMNPVPTGARGGYSRSPSDQREVERRYDVLVYTSAPLESPVEVTGPIVAHLWAASSATDTDFTVKLVDVHPDGTARALTDGILRARYRKSKTTPEPLTPGRPEELTIDVGATGNVFLAGHRIRVEISSSNFPRFDRNPNTGAPFGEGPAAVPARQTILHDREHPSRIVLPVVPREPQNEVRLGYTKAAFQRQRALEQRFRDGVSAERMSAMHAALTHRPHMAGTAGARAVSDSLVRILTDAGLAVEVVEYQAHLSLPREVAVEMVAPVRASLRVTEPVAPFDTSTRHPELGPGFVAYSGSGDVTAPIVYVNYGLPADYAALLAAGVRVRGKIALARYGRSHRAVKVFTAEQEGVAGLVLYSDPADDGFARGDTLPTGYWRTSHALQRGNAKYSWHFHGDPLTPGQPALAGAARLSAASAPTLPRIPVAVLSWGEAKEILERLGGPAAPERFRGALPLEYRTGNDSLRVRVHVRMDAGLRTIRNVIARVPGARTAGRSVMLGTHHDAWTFGGVDPGTGMATLLEVARGLGALRRSGWQPERTITIAFWDAEEFGLIGSTEYAEHRQRELRMGTIAYINTDLYTNGRLDAGGVPSLRDFLVEVAKDVPAAAGDGSIYDAWRADEWSRQPLSQRERGVQGFEVELKALGSGADFVPFQDHLGLPTLSIEFNATGGYTYGAYHSNYDTRSFVERVADPGFRRGTDLVRLVGTAALRLAQAEVLPFRFSHYARRLEEYVVAARGWATDVQGREAVALDLSALQAAVAKAAEEATALERRIDHGLASSRLSSAGTASLNDVLAQLEQRLLDESEPADKRWYRHVVYGWNIYSLYDGQPFPGLADAIRKRDAALVRREVERITAAVDRLVAGLREAAELAGEAL